ncbi:hypothetical protein BGZ49_006641 [Haplosporangium sp. Z 27]|nr:hypothetical protein BGZ49_006641 [Haplosporangium sp. Z 27]
MSHTFKSSKESSNKKEETSSATAAAPATTTVDTQVANTQTQPDAPEVSHDVYVPTENYSPAIDMTSMAATTL